MALTIERAEREFKFNGIALKDPDPKMSADEVREFYANIYPDMTSAAIEGPTAVGPKAVYEFRRAVGTKGAEEAPFAQWAIVELFGHQRVAGKVSEQTLGSGSFVRVDVPELPAREVNRYGRTELQPAISGFTKLYGNGAIYGITFVAEEVATLAAQQFRIEPINAFELQEALQAIASRNRAVLTGPRDPDDDEDAFRDH